MKSKYKGDQTLHDYVKKVPKGGLQNPGLRKGYGKNWSVGKLANEMYKKGKKSKRLW